MINFHCLLRSRCVYNVSRIKFSTSIPCCKKKGMIRRPLRVFTADEARRLAKGEKVQDPEPKKPVARFPDHLTEKAFTLPKGLSFVKLEDGDKRFRPAFSAKSRRDRREHRVIMLEGQRRILNAIDAGVKIKYLYFRQTDHLQRIPLTTTGAELYQVSHRQLELFSDAARSSGLMAIAELPTANLNAPTTGLMPMTVICDRISDPTIMGTILRATVACGVQRVILIKDCADVWDPKVLWAGAGAQFRCHFIDDVKWDMVGNYLSENCQILLIDNKAKHSDLGTVHKNKSDRTPAQARRHVEKSLREEEMMKRTDKHDDSEHVEHDYDEHPDDMGDNRNTPRGGGGGEKSPERIGTQNLYETDFTSPRETAVVISGELRGLHLKAYHLAALRGGSTLSLPIMPGTDSLSPAVAATGILFEARRQFLQNNDNVCNDDSTESSEDVAGDNKEDIHQGEDESTQSSRPPSQVSETKV